MNSQAATRLEAAPTRPQGDGHLPQAFYFAGDAAPGASPLVFDSPHSWRDWPASGTAPLALPEAVWTGWDAWIDELWATAAQGRAPVLAARFQRAFIDANRARDDIDASLLASPWPEPLTPSAACGRGMGLIRRLVLPGVPLYAQPLPVDEVRARITDYYDPYHQALEGLISAAHVAFGLSVHIDCHSMKSVGNGMNVDAGKARPDMVVSNLAGQTSDPFLLRWVVQHLSSLGYRVQANHPYQGAELVRRHGRPAQGRHSLQIEINRALYMDEARFERHDGFERLARDLGTLVAALDDGLRLTLYPPKETAK